MSDIFFWNAKVSNTYFSFGSAVKKNKSFVEISAGNNTSFGMSTQSKKCLSNNSNAKISKCCCELSCSKYNKI